MKIQLYLLVFTFLLSSGAHAREVITSFHSDILVQKNGDLLVSETIDVIAEGKQILRGIFRDFPTTYRSDIGTVTRVGFEVLSVERNGSPSPYHSESRSNGIRIYIGKSSQTIEPGEHRYRIEYRTTRQLGFFDDFDELYWNVTGNGWSFPIEQASARITLPGSASSRDIQMSGYTGPQGSSDQFLTHHIEESDRFFFETTRPLNPYEGLTVALGWPKGLVDEPSNEQKRQRFVDDNLHNLIAGAGLILVLGYYLAVWFKVGKDPEKGVIIPLYQAPEGFSPASTRFIRNMKYDKTCFTTALVNLTIKGGVTIDKDQADRYLVKKHNTENLELAPGESAILDKLFTNADSVTLKQSEHKTLRSALKAHESSLREDFEKLYFMTNKQYFFPGIIITLASIVFAVSQAPNPDTITSTIFLFMMTWIPFFIAYLTYKRWIKRRKPFSLISIAIQLVFSAIFFTVAGDAFLGMLTQLDSVAWPIVVSAFLMMASNILFEQWLKAPTLAGRKLLDKIEGLQLYLDVAEKDEMENAQEPRFTTDIYERFLPYAIALGVDNAWSRRLDSAITSGAVTVGYNINGFRYHNEYSSMTEFSDSLSGSFDSAISSSSTAPGSSSGSSSGGFSGGGGGGGGGGGW